MNRNIVNKKRYGDNIPPIFMVCLAFLLWSTGSVVLSAQSPAFKKALIYMDTLELSQEKELIGSIRELHVDKAGDFWVLDNRRCQVKRYDARGRLLTVLGGRGQGPGEFIRPFDFYFNSGKIMVTDPMAGRINIFDKKKETFSHFIKIVDGRSAKEINIPGTSEKSLIFIAAPMVPAGNGSGDMFSMHVINPEGEWQTSFFPVNHRAVKNRLISDGTYFCSDGEGHLYAVQEMDYTIHKFTLHGKLLNRFSRPASVYIPPPDTAFKKAHLRSKLDSWLRSWSHIIGINHFKNTLVVNYRNIRHKPYEHVIDIYDTKGNLIAGGLAGENRLLHVDKKGRFYFVEEAVGETDIRFNVKIYRLEKQKKLALK